MSNNKLTEESLEKIKILLISKSKHIKESQKEIDRILKLVSKDLESTSIQRKGLLVCMYYPYLLWDIVSEGESLSEFIKNWYEHVCDIQEIYMDNLLNKPLYFYNYEKTQWYILRIDNKFKINTKQVVDIV